MVFAFIYLIFNITLSVLLERRGRRSATVWHTLAFSVILLGLVVGCSEGTILEGFARWLVPNRYYPSFCEIVSSYGFFIFTPLMILEWIIPTAAFAVGTVIAVKLFLGKKQERDDETALPPSEIVSVSIPEFIQKLYRKNCVMRC